MLIASQSRAELEIWVDLIRWWLAFAFGADSLTFGIDCESETRVREKEMSLSITRFRDPVFLLGIVGTFAFVFAPKVWAQHSPPVRNLYLSPIEVFPDRDSSLQVNFTLQKDGRVGEQLQRQCYLMLYLKEDEKEILQVANAAEFATDDERDISPFLAMLERQHRLVTLRSAVSNHTPPANAISDEERRRASDQFKFEFTISHKMLDESLRRLKHFDPDKLVRTANSIWYPEPWKLMVFVPLNHSDLADKVDDTYRKTLDFGRAYLAHGPILYFRGLPYEFSLVKGHDQFILDVR